MNAEFIQRPPPARRYFPPLMISLVSFASALVLACGSGAIHAYRPADTLQAPADTFPLLPCLSLPGVREERPLPGTGGLAPPWEFRTVPSLLHSPGVAIRATAVAPLELLAPYVLHVHNSALPFSQNNGSLWAGRGSNFRIGGGVTLGTPRLRLTLAPELTSSSNAFYIRDRQLFWHPDPPVDRSEYTLLWYADGPFSVDYPIRFGEEPIRRLHPGQSSVLGTVGPLEAGFSTENHWWGPGMHNALVLSNNAPGFPHLLIRSARPFATRLGELEFRWLVGGLAESSYFDFDSTNDHRSLAAAAISLRPARAPNLVLGVTRAVMGTATGASAFTTRWFDVLRHVPPDRRALNDSSLIPGGREQLFSLFVRWDAPAAGLVTWAEWGRAELPYSLRDLLVAPNHTQAYTVGLSSERPGFREDDSWRILVENTSVEQSATFRDRPHPVWYTSRRVIQGWTHRGQVLGAAVGPGSSGQRLDLDYSRPGWTAGLYAGRHRYNEDVRNYYPLPEWQAWCTHDINLFWGARAAGDVRIGYVAADLTLGNRLQPWFQTTAGCPRGDGMLDVRNNTISITIAPFAKKGRNRQ